MRLFVSALEYSANIHLKYLLRELVARENIELCGIFDENIIAELRRECGKSAHFFGKSLCNIEAVGVIGFIDVLKRVRFFLELRKKCVNLALGSDKILLMDSSSFNIPLAKNIKKRDKNKGIMYYILPQVWAWKPWRAKIIEANCDKLAAILPFEVQCYAKKARFVGHPLLDEIKNFRDSWDGCVLGGGENGLRVNKIQQDSRKSQNLSNCHFERSKKSKKSRTFGKVLSNDFRNEYPRKSPTIQNQITPPPNPLPQGEGEVKNPILENWSLVQGGIAHLNSQNYDSRESCEIFSTLNSQNCVRINDSRESKNFFAYFFSKKVSGRQPKYKIKLPPPFGRGLGGGVSLKNESQNSKDSRELNESQKIFRRTPQNDNAPHLPIFTFMPGSRLSEINRIFPIFLQVKDMLKKHDSTANFNLVVPKKFKGKNLAKIYGDISDFHITYDAHTSLLQSTFAFICSGTATLEAALIGTPFVLGYQGRAIEAFVVKQFLNIKFVGLANLLYTHITPDSQFHTELLQENLTAKNLLDSYHSANPSEFLKKSLALRAYLKSGSANVVAQWLLEK